MYIINNCICNYILLLLIKINKKDHCTFLVNNYYSYIIEDEKYSIG